MAGFSNRLNTAGSSKGFRGQVEVAGDALDDGLRARW